ncbi:MAG: DUF1629 domain-containing protein [Pseudomonadota bacterium]
MEVWYCGKDNISRYRLLMNNDWSDGFVKLAHAQGYDQFQHKRPGYSPSALLFEGYEVNHPYLIPSIAKPRWPKTARKRNPAFMWVASTLFVIDEVRDFFETVEPGTHQFFPMKIQFPDGTESPVNYNLMNIHTQIDALDRSQSTAKIYRPEQENWAWSWGVPRSCVFKESAVKGRYLWREKRSLNKLFGSGELVEEMRKRKCAGLDPVGPCVVNPNS